MDATVTWKHDLAFTGIGAATNFPVSLGTHIDGAPSEGASPLELLLMGTAGCTAMDVIVILQKKRQEVTGFEIRVHAERTDEHPRVFSHITLEYVITGHQIDPDAVSRAIDLSLEKYCSAHAMMSKVAPITHTFRVVEA